MTPAPRIWLYSPAAGILEALVIGPPEVIASFVVFAINGIASCTDFHGVQTIGLGLHAMLMIAHLSPDAQHDAIGTALDALRHAMPAGAVEWRADPTNSMIGVL